MTETDPIMLLIFCSLVVQKSKTLRQFKADWHEIWHDYFPDVNHGLMESDFLYYVTVSRYANTYAHVVYIAYSEPQTVNTQTVNTSHLAGYSDGQLVENEVKVDVAVMIN